MTNPTLEQVEAARAEYDRSEDMCAALVAAAELTGEIARPGHDDSCRRERAEQATEEEPAQPRPPFLLSQSRVNESEGDPENSEGNNAGHASTIRGAAAQEPTSERCGDCGDKLDYVAGLDGNGCFPHCWRCWYKDHPVEIPVQVDEAKLAELLKKHRQAVYEWAEGDGCLCGITLQGDGGLKPGPEEVVEHISAVIVEWLRGGGQ